ncbi:MAG: helix-turn-helix transcriptional regulator [Pseudomonadota bacterium]
MHWMLNSDHSHLPVSAGQTARLIREIGNIDRAALAGAVLDTINAFLPVQRCTVLAYESDRNPRLLSAACHGGSGNEQWSTFNAASLYVREGFRHDPVLAILPTISPEQGQTGMLVHRQRAGDVTDAACRAACYGDDDVVDRVVVLLQVGKRRWVATQLHRNAAQGCFSGAELETLCGLAPLFASCAVTHYRSDSDGESCYRGAVTDGIGELCPSLTTREREVLLRILDGLTTERIALDLTIRPTTVITYRTRAYEKLGVSSRRELFAVVLRKQSGADVSGAPEYGQAGATPQSPGTHVAPVPAHHEQLQAA